MKLPSEDYLALLKCVETIQNELQHILLWVKKQAALDGIKIDEPETSKDTTHEPRAS